MFASACQQTELAAPFAPDKHHISPPVNSSADSRPKALPVFLPLPDLSRSSWAVRRALHSSRVTKSVHCVLGPHGTNIAHAASHWSIRMHVTNKSELRYCCTPEAAIEAARTTRGDVLAVFWTCAVYFQEHLVFFDNPDCLPFFFAEEMPLDEMQLAARPDVVGQATLGQFPAAWRILSHPSPAPLLKSLPCRVMVANSNADAAARCAKGEAEACITTRTARELHRLIHVHTFGSPLMVFFGGITSQGLRLLIDAFHKEAN